MKKTLLVFALSFTFFFGLLYMLAGGIWSTPRSSPLQISESKGNNITDLAMGDRNVKLYSYHTVKDGHYYHYRDGSRELDFEIHFSEMSPWSASEVIFKYPSCIYYVQKTSGKMATPRKFVVTAHSGILKQENRAFSSLLLRDEVVVQGYGDAGNVLTTIKTSELSIDFISRFLETQHKVQFAHEKVFSADGVGMRAHTNLDKVTLKRDGILTIFPGILQADVSSGKREIQFDHIRSRCNGPTEIDYQKRESLLEISQQENVIMESERARLTCEKVKFYLYKTPQQQWEIQKYRAEQNITFKDGQDSRRNEAVGGFFQLEYLTQQGMRIPKITMRENPKIIIRSLEGFSLISDEKRKQLAKEQDRLELAQLVVSSKGSLEWERKLTEVSMREDFYFSKDVYIQEIVEGQRIRTLTGDDVRLALEDRSRKLPGTTQAKSAGQQKATQNKLATQGKVPLSLKAVGNARLSHEGGESQGDTLHWVRQSDWESKTILSGTPQILLKEITMDEGNDFFNGVTTLAQPKSKEKPSHATKNLEDMRIFSHDDMVLYSLRTPYGNRLTGCALAGDMISSSTTLVPATVLHYQTARDVRVVRYQSGTNQVLGNLCCDKLTVVLSKKMADQKINASTGNGKPEKTPGDKASAGNDKPGKTPGDKASAGNDKPGKANAPEGVLVPKRSKGTEGPTDSVGNMTMESLQARGRVVFIYPEIKGEGGILEFQEKQGHKKLTLSENARLESKDGEIRGQNFVYHTDGGVFTAVGQPVSLKSRELKGRGNTLYYYKKDERMLLIGEPAVLYQLDKTGNVKDTLNAREIEYYRNSGEARARHDVDLVFTMDEASQSPFSFVSEVSPAKKLQDKGKNTQQNKRYRMLCKELYAKFDAEKKTMSCFNANDKVLVERIIDSPQDKLEKAVGDRISYDGTRGILYGNPALLYSDGNQLTGAEFHFDKAKDEFLCQEPKRVVLGNVKAQTALFQDKPSTQDPTEPKDMEITCVDPIRFVRADNKIEFRRQVVVRNGQNKLECEKLDVILEQQKVASLIAHENVKLFSDNYVVLGDRLHWDEKSGWASLIGFPSVKFKSNDFSMASPIVWYHIPSRRFFSRDRDTIFKEVGK